jgi:hypothetical protein
MTSDRQPSASEIDLAYTLLLEDLTLAVLEAEANLDLARRVKEPLERLVVHGATRDEGHENHRRAVSTLIRIREVETILLGQRDALRANFAFYKHRREAHFRAVVP